MLLEALKSDNEHIRQLVIRTLSELPTPAEGPRPEVLDAFVAAMEDAEPEVVGEVMAALAARGKAALPGILRGLANDKARPYAVRVAALLGPDAEPALPALLEAWKGTADDPALRGNPIRAGGDRPGLGRSRARIDQLAGIRRSAGAP